MEKAIDDALVNDLKLTPLSSDELPAESATVTPPMTAIDVSALNNKKEDREIESANQRSDEHLNQLSSKNLSTCDDKDELISIKEADANIKEKALVGNKTEDLTLNINLSETSDLNKNPTGSEIDGLGVGSKITFDSPPTHLRNGTAVKSELLKETESPARIPDAETLPWSSESPKVELCLKKENPDPDSLVESNPSTAGQASTSLDQDELQLMQRLMGFTAPTGRQISSEVKEDEESQCLRLLQEVKNSDIPEGALREHIRWIRGRVCCMLRHDLNPDPFLRQLVTMYSGNLMKEITETDGFTGNVMSAFKHGYTGPRPTFLFAHMIKYNKRWYEPSIYANYLSQPPDPDGDEAKLLAEKKLLTETPATGDNQIEIGPQLPGSSSGKCGESVVKPSAEFVLGSNPLMIGFSRRKQEHADLHNKIRTLLQNGEGIAKEIDEGLEKFGPLVMKGVLSGCNLSRTVDLLNAQTLVHQKSLELLRKESLKDGVLNDEDESYLLLEPDDESRDAEPVVFIGQKNSKREDSDCEDVENCDSRDYFSRPKRQFRRRGSGSRSPLITKGDGDDIVEVGEMPKKVIKRERLSDDDDDDLWDIAKDGREVLNDPRSSGDGNSRQRRRARREHAAKDRDRKDKIEKDITRSERSSKVNRSHSRSKSHSSDAKSKRKRSDGRTKRTDHSSRTNRDRRSNSRSRRRSSKSRSRSRFKSSRRSRSPRPLKNRIRRRSKSISPRNSGRRTERAGASERLRIKQSPDSLMTMAIKPPPLLDVDVSDFDVSMLQRSRQMRSRSRERNFRRSRSRDYNARRFSRSRSNSMEFRFRDNFADRPAGWLEDQEEAFRQHVRSMRARFPDDGAVAFENRKRELFEATSTLLNRPGFRGNLVDYLHMLSSSSPAFLGQMAPFSSTDRLLSNPGFLLPSSLDYPLTMEEISRLMKERESARLPRSGPFDVGGQSSGLMMDMDEHGLDNKELPTSDLGRTFDTIDGALRQEQSVRYSEATRLDDPMTSSPVECKPDKSLEDDIIQRLLGDGASSSCIKDTSELDASVRHRYSPEKRSSTTRHIRSPASSPTRRRHSRRSRDIYIIDDDDDDVDDLTSDRSRFADDVRAPLSPPVNRRRLPRSPRSAHNRSRDYSYDRDHRHSRDDRSRELSGHGSVNADDEATEPRYTDNNRRNVRKNPNYRMRFGNFLTGELIDDCPPPPPTEKEIAAQKEAEERLAAQKALEEKKRLERITQVGNRGYRFFTFVEEVQAVAEELKAKSSGGDKTEISESSSTEEPKKGGCDEISVGEGPASATKAKDDESKAEKEPESEVKTLASSDDKTDKDSLTSGTWGPPKTGASTINSASGTKGAGDKKPVVVEESDAKSSESSSEKSKTQPPLATSTAAKGRGLGSARGRGTRGTGAAPDAIKRGAGRGFRGRGGGNVGSFGNSSSGPQAATDAGFRGRGGMNPRARGGDGRGGRGGFYEPAGSDGIGSYGHSIRGGGMAPPFGGRIGFPSNRGDCFRGPGGFSEPRGPNRFPGMRGDRGCSYGEFVRGPRGFPPGYLGRGSANFRGPCDGPPGPGFVGRGSFPPTRPGFNEFSGGGIRGPGPRAFDPSVRFEGGGFPPDHYGTDFPHTNSGPPPGPPQNIRGRGGPGRGRGWEGSSDGEPPYIPGGNRGNDSWSDSFDANYPSYSGGSLPNQVCSEDPNDATGINNSEFYYEENNFGYNEGVGSSNKFDNAAPFHESAIGSGQPECFNAGSGEPQPSQQSHGLGNNASDNWNEPGGNLNHPPWNVSSGSQREPEGFNRSIDPSQTSIPDRSDTGYKSGDYVARTDHNDDPDYYGPSFYDPCSDQQQFGDYYGAEDYSNSGYFDGRGSTAPMAGGGPDVALFGGSPPGPPSEPPPAAVQSLGTNCANNSISSYNDGPSGQLDQSGYWE